MKKSGSKAAIIFNHEIEKKKKGSYQYSRAIKRIAEQRKSSGGIGERMNSGPYK